VDDTGERRGTIRQYTVEMTKRLHMIIVSDDFTHFLHIHPVLGADGHFTIDAPFRRRPSTIFTATPSRPGSDSKSSVLTCR